MLNRDKNSNDDILSYRRNKWTTEVKLQVGVLLTLAAMFFTLVVNIFQGGYRTAEQIDRISSLEKQVGILVEASNNAVTQPVRLDNLEQRMQTVEKTLDLRAEYGQRYAGRLDVLEARFDEFKKSIDRIEISVAKIADREYTKR